MSIEHGREFHSQWLSLHLCRWRCELSYCAVCVNDLTYYERLSWSAWYANYFTHLESIVA